MYYSVFEEKSFVAFVFLLFQKYGGLEIIQHLMPMTFFIDRIGILNIGIIEDAAFRHIAEYLSSMGCQ
jgi:hypothetical protein